MSGRWQVLRGYTMWRALDPECKGGEGLLKCPCKYFRTWREAFDYADRMARADR